MKQWHGQKNAALCLREATLALDAKRYLRADKTINDSLFEWENKKGIGQENKGEALRNAAVYLVCQGEEKIGGRVLSK